MAVASSKRIVADAQYFYSEDPAIWEELYQSIMEKKYAKRTRKFSTVLKGTSQNASRIYIIPRIRAGPSYLKMPLSDDDNTNLQYCPISKGFPMQDVSSFTLGPIVGEGLCLVNAAFSKSITVAHIEGGGCVNLKAKNFWHRAKNPLRQIRVLDSEFMLVDNIKTHIFTWLLENEALWYEPWNTWRMSIALCSRGDFHWTDGLDDTIAFHNNKGASDKYIDFVTWKKECYIKPSYQLLPNTEVFQFLQTVYEQKIPIGLVHPKGFDEETLTPITGEYIDELFNDPQIMCCQPYVIAGCLLKVFV